jgi:hypothetical protein
VTLSGQVCGDPVTYLALAALPLAWMSGALKDLLRRRLGVETEEKTDESGS